MNTVNKVSGISKFLFSTLVAAAAMTSTAWAEGTTVTVSSASEIKTAISTVNNASGGEINLDTVAYEYSKPLHEDADMATITNAGTYTIIGGKGALLNYELEVNPDSGQGSYVLKVDDAFLTVTKLTLRDNVTATISDSRVDTNEAQYETGSAFLSVYKDSSLKISNSIVGLNPYVSGFNETYTVETAANLIKNSSATTSSGGYWNWAPRVSVYGSLDIEDSTLFVYVGQADGSGFDVLGNGTAQVKNSTISLALMNVGSAYTEKYLDSSITDTSNLLATVTLDNAVVRNTQYRGDTNTDAVKNGINIGSGTTAGKLIIKNNSDVDFTVLRYNDAREIGLQVNNAKSSVEITDSVFKAPKITNAGTISVSKSVLTADTVTNNGEIEIDGGSLTAKEISGSGRIVANGELGMTFDSLTNTRLFVGRHYDEDGNRVWHNDPSQRSTVNLSSVSGQGITVSSNIFNFNNTNLILNDKLNVVIPGTVPTDYLFMSNTSINLGGHNMNVGGSFVMNGVSIDNGTLTIDGAAGNQNVTTCFQALDSSIGKDATLIVKNGPFGFYADTVINGKVEASNITNSINIGVNSKNSDGTPWVESVAVNVEGTFSTDGGLTIQGKVVSGTTEVAPSELNVAAGGSVSAVTITNNGIINIDGGSLTAVNVTNNGSITLNNATLIVTGTLTNNGTLTMLGNSKISDGNTEDASGVALREITVATGSGSEVAISATANILFSGIQEITVADGDIDVSSITNGKVAGAWHFDIDGIDEGQSVTVSTTVDTGLNLNTIKVFHKEDGTDTWDDVTDDVNLTYDAETGAVSFTTNTFSSYAVAIPEPSAFGLLAGLGAIALAVSRRRRRTR